jgi:hypothetical protein
MDLLKFTGKYQKLNFYMNLELDVKDKKITQNI